MNQKYEIYKFHTSKNFSSKIYLNNELKNDLNNDLQNDLYNVPKTSLSHSTCQKKKIRSSCTCNFKLVDEPETKMINVFPNKVRKSTCDDDAIEGCKQLCIKRVNRLK